MKLLITLLLHLISFQNVYTQTVPKEAVSDYLNILTTLMWQTLKDYGISNLPDVDTKIPYNVSKEYGYTLIGDLYFEDGFVMDITSLVMFSKENSAVLTEDTIKITCDMKFGGLSILRDFRYESQQGHIVDQSFGSVVITPANVQSHVIITKYLENNTVDVQCSNDLDTLPGKNFLKYYPENGLTIRLRKLNVRPDALSGLWDLWKPIFSNFLKSIVSKVEFPSLVYEFARNVS